MALFSIRAIGGSDAYIATGRAILNRDADIALTGRPLASKGFNLRGYRRLFLAESSGADLLVSMNFALEFPPSGKPGGRFRSRVNSTLQLPESIV
jgi:hypothetical protein